MIVAARTDSAVRLRPPVRKCLSACKCPRATVPGTNGRADRPSAKKVLGSSGRYFGCLAICCWQPTNRQTASDTNRGTWLFDVITQRLLNAALPLPLVDAMSPEKSWCSADQTWD